MSEIIKLSAAVNEKLVIKCFYTNFSSEWLFPTIQYDYDIKIYAM